MCGIVGAISKESVSTRLLEKLTTLEYRGYDSAGMAVISDNLNVIKNVGYIKDALPLDDVVKIKGNVGIAHTRWATHGKVSKENAHPFVDCKNEIAIVHNGIIENFKELKEKLKGHTFTSETDSEVIVHLIEEYEKEYGWFEGFDRAVKDLKGSYAIIALNLKHPKGLMAVRKDSPLYIGKYKDGFIVASDLLALEDADSWYDCPDVGENITKEIKPESTYKTPDKGEFPDFMLKEIHEQPETFKQSLNQDLEQIAQELKYSNLMMVACGSSLYAAEVGEHLLARIAGKPSKIYTGSEFGYDSQQLSDRVALLAISQSGETADIIDSVNVAKERGVTRIVSIINREESTLSRLSKYVIPMNCGPEIGVAATKSFTSQLAIFYQLAYAMAGEKKDYNIPIKECLEENLVKRVADALCAKSSMYFVGRGINYAIASECALKMKEISYIHAESMRGGELKHGSLALITKDTPLVGICPDDYTHQDTMSNLHEAKARGAFIIGISDKKDDVFDEWLPIPKVEEIFYPVVSVIIGQLLAYYTAVAKGLNPDKPRNLAKSVTVR